ncbi:MAG: PIG-L deacetylase family protein [Faecousia sp.]
MQAVKLNGTILVAVPHSDDEIILFGGLTQRALKENHDVFVALVTNGDYEASTEAQGSIRPLETIEGLKVLGLPEDHIFLMGYADTGMPKSESFLWRLWEETEENKVQPSHVGTHTYGCEGHFDFHRAKHGEPAPYTRKAFRQDLAELLSTVNPNMVFTTHPEDAHGDHAGLYQFLKELVGERKLYTAFCHSNLGDAAWPLQGDCFTCPPGLDPEWERAVSLALTTDEGKCKGQALEKHKAALKPDAVDFLRSFVKQDEIYFPVEETR